jgi:hypothetical protein
MIQMNCAHGVHAVGKQSGRSALNNRLGRAHRRTSAHRIIPTESHNLTTTTTLLIVPNQSDCLPAETETERAATHLPIHNDEALT